MVSLAELARYDSRMTRIVGFVALVYLPVSLVSVCSVHFALFTFQRLVAMLKMIVILMRTYRPFSAAT